ncbi:MAG: cyclic beta 1-2 glucan synthetase [Myxococcota bacterium]|jgi:cellobiose phosphorylase|nr:cyclic beta 1-2 glucan synthetase [Myxococcota bacterium]
MKASPAKTGQAPTSAELSGWAQSLYRRSVDDPLLSGAVFAIEQLELHAKGLAISHVLGRHRGRDQFLGRLADSERVIGRCHELMSRAHAAGRRLTPAAEWLLDNHYLIEEQVFLARKHLPRGYSRQLPRLEAGEHAGLPRVYDLIREFIAHVDGRVDDEALARYTEAYQSVSHLTLGEIWSVAIMLRIALIENLQRVAVKISWQQAHRDSALAWAQRIDAPSEQHESALLVLAEMVRDNPILSTPFVSQFTQALQGRGATTTFVLAWLEQRLAEQGQTIEEVVRAESQSQAASQASMANSIASLRLVNATRWSDFVEAHSAVERILESEPAGVYSRMDLATRDQYRHVVESMARRLHLDEETVARAAVELVARRHEAQPGDAAAHVGYVLIDDGKRQLVRALRGRPHSEPRPPRLMMGLRLLGYLGPIALLSGAGTAGFIFAIAGAVGRLWPVWALLAAVVLSQFAIGLLNWLASVLRAPQSLPRMDFEGGIPDEHRTIVVVPTLLSGHKRISAIIEGLELRYLANRDPNLWFGLLTDFADASEEHVESDDSLLQLAAKGIEELNDKYGNGKHGRFFLFHRPRLLNRQEGCWMGRERKRGKLEDFNALLCGEDRNCFSKIVGGVSELCTLRHVITLDTDSDLPWGSAWRLVGAAAHPLNRPVIVPGTRRLVRGYAILQPRVSISLSSAAQSRYSAMLAGEVGIDPYTRLVSDVSQDLFGETSFIGKGIYDVLTFRLLLDGRFPDNTVLSHDLLESCYARCGQCSDVELLEDSPSSYLADVSRRHRWMRGDWQIAPWLGRKRTDAAGRKSAASIGVLGQWKIFDNLRRAAVAPAYTTLLALVWFFLGAPVLWTSALLLLLVLTDLLPASVELWQRPTKLPLWLHVTAVGRATSRRLARTAAWLAFLPFESTVALDATGRSLWRMLVSRKHLLQWQTAAAVERATTAGFGHVLRRMWVGPLLALSIVAALFAVGAGDAFVLAGPILALWFASSAVAWWISRPQPPRALHLDEADTRFLRRIARLTWRYFEVFTGPQENWLPPDNFQEGSGHRVAHRTSPTDIGLALLSNLSAHDLGYVSLGQLLERTNRTFDSLDQLERFRGHFYNWYDTTTRKPLRPLYVSTVDSGNLIGHVRVLRSGLLELATGPILPQDAVEGLRDTLNVLTELVSPDLRPKQALKLLVDQGSSLRASAAWLAELKGAAARLCESFDRHSHPEAAWWATAFERQVSSFLADLHELSPWLFCLPEPQDAASQLAISRLDQATSLEELGELCQRAAETLTRTPPQGAAHRLAEALELGAQRISHRLLQIDSLVQRCSGLTEVEFGFLYNSTRKLLAIGYFAADRRMDNSFYDLLASEARLASFAAIASGQLPFDHWFALGRRLTMARGKQVLLSWSGSMFEYLMPRLVMPGFEGTLLDQTCHAAVARQIEYGRQRGVPWGISECCYNLCDLEGTYQYRAFGVPGLGLQRGLGDDVVVAPYASILALLVHPQGACANLRRMADSAYVGPYGFYEAIDFTSVRMGEGQRAAVVTAFMAHHHGMSLLALEHAVLGPKMQDRFLSNPDYRAAALLLQERIPKATALISPHAREAQASRRIDQFAPSLAMRVFTNPSGPIPEIQLLSNGHYHVMISAAGSGYSRWNDLALTRWREDPTAESFGVFCFIGDSESHHVWSNSFQPTLRAGRRYEAVFTSARAEFRRQDDQIETHTEIAVSTEDDLEIRRIRLHNRSRTPRSLLVTAYAEAVLAPGIADELHRAFSNLFAHTELAPEQSAILITRRPRSAEEQSPWMFCLMLAPEREWGPCSYETDRERCLGRGRSARHPAMLDDWGPLSGSAGTVLDPCVALRRSVDIPIDGTAQVDLIIGAAASREGAMELIQKYQDHRMADRVFEVAATHSKAVLGQLGTSESEAQLYGQLAPAVIFPLSAFRAPSSILRRNRKGQAGLWPYAISGDLPIVLLCIRDADSLKLVRDLIAAHAFWRSRGLLADLVIWNEGASGYRRDLTEQILGLVAASTEPQLVDKPGGVFVRHIDAFPEEDRVLLQAMARIVIRDTDGPLDHQLERWRLAATTSRTPMLNAPTQTAPPPTSLAPISPRTDLIFANGLGGFTRDGREYIIDLARGRHTPAPWINVIANARLGTVVSESGSAYTWYGNAQLYRLSPWSNDAVTDPSGEIIYLRDEATGHSFSPMPWPRASDAAYTCRHGFGYSIFEHREDGLETELTTYIGVDSPVKYSVLKLKNLEARRRTISVMASVDLVLGDLRSKQAMHVVTELEPLTGAILARNSYNSEFPGAVSFFDCSETQRSVSGDRTEILGRNGDPSQPATLRLRQLSGRLGPGLDPCMAMHATIELAEGAQREIVFILGAGENTAEAVSLIARHRGVAAARVALEEVWRFWKEKLGVLHAETPDPALDVLMNGWLPYQILSCRMLGRSGFYQSGGAYGFRDQLQDCVALLHEVPHLAREHLLRCAKQQFVEGDVQHWWHPPSGRGVRTRCSDDYLWLPYAVARYVSFTGDTGVLDEPIPYLTGRTLGSSEESYYDLPGRSDQTGSLYEHCTRAILNGRKLGEHNLPLMGSGDWNDGMNRVGHLGKGESHWLGFFLHEVLTRFSALAQQRGDESFGRHCLTTAKGLANQIETHAWDGQWYRRATFDSGELLGSSRNAQCQIDSLPQSWATLTALGDPQRREQALDSLWNKLVCQEHQLVRLFTPPFDHSPLDPGYVQGYPPGVRENGGQYTHAAVWAAMAFSLAGRSEQAQTLLSFLNPIHHALSPEAVERYKVEPYVLAGDIYSEPPYAGRGGWSWYTGSAAWYYRLLHEVLFGIERRADTLRFSPAVPRSWTAFKLHYRYYQTFYHVAFTQSQTHKGSSQLTLDGTVLQDGLLRLVNDQNEHTVEVLFGPPPDQSLSR